MGMYDYIRCEHPLPVAGLEGREFQTKDTPSQFLDRYTIKEDGTLWHHAYDHRVEEDPDAPLGVWFHQDNPREEPVRLTGEVRFYDFASQGVGFMRAGWVELSAYFIDGALQSLVVVKHEPATA